MRGTRGLISTGVFVAAWLLASGGFALADEPEAGRDDQLSLADLVGYRAALSGKATADHARSGDPPSRVGFRDLWDRTDLYRGRRVTVRGRVARTFRQGAIGSFPPLLQSWIFSSAGDPFCVVSPLSVEKSELGSESLTASVIESERGTENHQGPTKIPGPGQTVRFTGTFLKMVRYAAGDGDRLAPLIVGDRLPESAPADPNVSAESRTAKGGKRPDDWGGSVVGRWGWSSSSWGLGLMVALVAAGLLARQHLRNDPIRRRSAVRDRVRDSMAVDPPLEFIDHANESLV